MRQIEIDIEAAQSVRSDHAVERADENARHIHRCHANPSPWYRHTAYGEAAQLDLAGIEAAAEAPQLTLKFDYGALRPDPSGGGGCQHCRFRPGIEQERHRSAVGKQRDDRRVAQGRDGRLTQSNRSAAAGRISDSAPVCAALIGAWVERVVPQQRCRAGRRSGGISDCRNKGRRHDRAAEPSVHRSIEPHR